MFSSCDNGSYRTCWTNGLGMYTPPRASPVISVLYDSYNKDPTWMCAVLKSSSDPSGCSSKDLFIVNAIDPKNARAGSF